MPSMSSASGESACGLPRLKVKSSAVQTLSRSRIEDIASSLASPDAVPSTPVEELTYRRSLRVALDLLNPSTPSPREAGAPEDAGTPLAPEAVTDTATARGDAAGLGAGEQDPARQDPAGSAPWEEDPQCPSDPSREPESPQPPGADRPPSDLPAAPCSPPRASAPDCDCELPSGDPTGPPESGAGPPKRLRLDSSREPEPALSTEPEAKACTPPHSPPSPGPPAPEKLEGADWPSCVESMELSSIQSLLEEEEDDEEPPRILLYHEPRSFEVGMLVWLKYQKYPFWPAVVKSIRRRDRKASVLFIEGDMDPKGRGIAVSLRRLKHFDCKEKQALLTEAKEEFEQAIGWCVSLITDYRVRLGCGSFSGSFLEYYAADISYPVRKSIQRDVLGTRFPPLSAGAPEEPAEGSPWGRRPPCRKVLPDRSRAARDRANQKLVEYIVKARGAEGHLRDILKNRKQSRWLKTFLSSAQCVTCVETYLEDEAQLDLVVKYLQGVCRDAGPGLLARINGDRIRFILDVLLPEAVICAISAVDAVDYKTAEEKYIKGPSLGYREREIFDNQLLEERSRRGC
ncbi:PWWP domain-containing DNA repair factor 3A isoform X2 [Sorex araneus]|uniref:PWWP domain-containing DNA repair factor 3A isoform X2 n=1 Tax=Sorex araneus TaxID=42254 RepID=UPI00243397D8|nr:PWWP domain-containing DNA repair factor 3A isoform X2 [Sorex araneus]XP_054983479.1 PWWP domain-containing DNA repair factor 3A isoform X2 [Sorex araneus]XP_054983480.1 PWWP domain-containing DNA repair factor 3A isoform X2 [Sorex araneus]